MQCMLAPIPSRKHVTFPHHPFLVNTWLSGRLHLLPSSITLSQSCQSCQSGNRIEMAVMDMLWDGGRRTVVVMADGSASLSNYPGGREGLAGRERAVWCFRTAVGGVLVVRWSCRFPSPYIHIYPYEVGEVTCCQPFGGGGSSGSREAAVAAVAAAAVVVGS